MLPGNLNSLYTCFIACFMCLTLHSCSNVTCIKGQLENFDGKTYKSYIYLVKPSSFDELVATYQGDVIDSAYIDTSGNFNFDKLQLTENTMVLLTLQKSSAKFNNYLQVEDVETSNYIPLVLSYGTCIDLKADAPHLLHSYTLLNPNDTNIEIWNLKNVYTAAYSVFLQNLPPPDEENLMDIEKSIDNFKDKLMPFIEKSNSPLVVLLGIKWMSMDMNYERTPEFVMQQCLKLSQLNTGEGLVNSFCRKATKPNLPVLIGDDVSNTILPLVNDQSLPLKDLLGSKLTILDLWASWCGPCRKENKTVLLPLWQKYHDQGLQIIGYGLESDKTNWQQAIAKDGAEKWLHASHLMGDDSPLFQKWKISSIPANYILDEKGIIIERNLHGNDLTAFVENYFSNQAKH